MMWWWWNSLGLRIATSCLHQTSYCISVSAMSHSKNAPLEASPMAKTHQPAPSVRNHVSVMIRPNKHVTWGKPHQHMRESPPGDIWWPGDVDVLPSGYFSHSHGSHGSHGPFIDRLPIKNGDFRGYVSHNQMVSPQNQLLIQRRMIQEAREPQWAQDSAGARFQVPCPILGWWKWNVPWMTLWLRNRTFNKLLWYRWPIEFDLWWCFSWKTGHVFISRVC